MSEPPTPTPTLEQWESPGPPIWAQVLQWSLDAGFADATRYGLGHKLLRLSAAAYASGYAAGAAWDREQGAAAERERCAVALDNMGVGGWPYAERIRALDPAPEESRPTQASIDRVKTRTGVDRRRAGDDAMTPEQRKTVEDLAMTYRNVSTRWYGRESDRVNADALDALLAAPAEARGEAYAECAELCELDALMYAWPRELADLIRALDPAPAQDGPCQNCGGIGCVRCDARAAAQTEHKG